VDFLVEIEKSTFLVESEKSTFLVEIEKSTVEKNPPWKKIHQIQNPPWKKIHRGKKSTVDFQTRAVDFDKSGLIFGTPLSRWIFNFVDFDEERKIRQFEKAKSTALFTAKFTAIFSRWISKIHRGKKSTNSKSTENPPNSKSTVEKNPPWKKIHQIQNPPWKKIHRGKKSTNSKSTVEQNPPSTFCRFRVHCGE
jgi:hypothetical protein